MRVKVLGSAAGGGFPQWNCGCRNCSALRAGKFHGKPRSQTQLAVSEDGDTWFLLGASPDLRTQIEATPELHPSKLRHSPIAGVVLTSADIDHVAGLLSLRELQPLRIYGSAYILRILRQENSLFRALNRVPNQAVWTEIVSGQNVELTCVNDTVTGLHCDIVRLGSHIPAYAEASGDTGQEASVCGLIVRSSSGGTLAYMSAVPAVDDKLLQRLQAADLLLFDGTFWSDDELIRVQKSGQTARQMGHLPVGAQDGSLQRLAGVRRPRKIFVHLNNTNPMLDESSVEYRTVREAGWEIAEDGWQFEL
jgi:pyrroloquinoline quinone biosynthesis protein B